MSQIWNDEDAGAAERLARELLKRAEFSKTQKDEAGWPHVAWDGRSSLVAHSFDELAALARNGPTSIAITASTIKLAFGRMGPRFSSLAELGRLCVEVQAEIDRRERTRIRPWTLLIPLRLHLIPPLTATVKLTSLGRRYDLVSIRSASRTTHGVANDAKEIAKHTLTSHKVEVPPIYARLAASGPTLADAWNSTLDEFTALRGAVELVHTANSDRITQTQKPRAVLPHPPWVLGVHAGTVEGAEFEYYDAPDTELRLDPAALAMVRRTLQLVRNGRVPGSLGSLFLDALRLYEAAADARYDRWQFLGFWQFAERLTLADDSKGSTAEVCRRLAWFGERWGLYGTGWAARLAELASLRNELVHRGTAHVTCSEVNDVKAIAMTLFRWIRKNRDTLRSEDGLRLFFQLRSRPDKELQRDKRRVARLVASERAATLTARRHNKSRGYIAPNSPTIRASAYYPPEV